MSSTTVPTPRRTESATSTGPPSRSTSRTYAGAPSRTSSKSSVVPSRTVSSCSMETPRRTTPRRSVRAPRKAASRSSVRAARKSASKSIALKPKLNESAEAQSRQQKSATKISAEERTDGKSAEAIRPKVKFEELKTAKYKSVSEMDDNEEEEQKGGKELWPMDSAEKRERLQKYEDQTYNEDRAPDVVLGSVLKSMKESISARERSDSDRATLHALTRTLIGLVLFTTFSVFGFLEVFVGIIKVGTCPLQPMIPIWLLLAGLLSVVFNVLAIVFTMLHDKKARVLHTRDCVMGILTAVWLVWLILGSYYVYEIYDIVDYEQSHPNYCDRFVYSFAFLVITITYVLLGILLACACYCVVFLCCHNSSVIIIT